MPVIIRYIVERNGEEKMTFVSKKEADAYDKELDIAENLQDLLGKAEFHLDEAAIEAVSLYLARNGDEINLILKGAKSKNPKKQMKKNQSVSPLGVVESGDVEPDPDSGSEKTQNVA